jgi:ribonuclease HI
MPDFVCRTCGTTFTVPEAALAKFPGWTPAKCMDCKPGGRKKPAARRPAAGGGALLAGPQTGIFTDGSSDPNPGPGGWGAVKVHDGIVIDERSGNDPATTNNRMELRALIEAYAMLDGDEEIVIYSDSALCVNTINLWAPKWRANGWRRGKDRDPVMNVDLVQELYALATSHPTAKLEWIKAHATSQWNEYADMLSRVYKDGHT